MSEDFVKDVKTLLASGKGDTRRLREILDSMKQNTPVYMSDYKYIQNLISEGSSNEKTETANVQTGLKLEDPLELLRIRLAEGKITVDEFRDLKKAIADF